MAKKTPPKKVVPPGSVQVVATETGFYGGSRKRAGEKFWVKEGQKAAWFVPVGQAKEVPAAPKSEEPRTLSELGKQAAKGPEDQGSEEGGEEDNADLVD